MPTILVVEDNPTNMKLASVILNASGYTVFEAENAAKAIEIARSTLPDLILMDIQLPEIDGLTATGILKQDEATRDIKIVALTAFAMKGDEDRILAAGCDAYIPKPIRHKNFLETVERLLGEKALKGAASR